MKRKNNSGRILGIDWGEVNIGIAVSDLSLSISQPLGCIKVNDWGKFYITLKKIVEEYNIVRIVVGCPYSENGEVGKTALKVKKFIKNVKKHVTAHCICWDERYSTLEVEKNFRGIHFKKNKKKNKNSISASIVLQSYLDAIKNKVEK